MSVLLLQNIRGGRTECKTCKNISRIELEISLIGTKRRVFGGNLNERDVPDVNSGRVLYDLSRDLRTKSAIIATETYSRQCSTKSAFNKDSREALRVGSR